MNFGQTLDKKITLEVVAKDEASPTLQRVQKGLALFASGLALKQAGAALTAFGTKVIEVAVASGKMALDYNAAMTRVAALTEGGAKDVTNLSQKVLDLGGATAQAPLDLAKALYFVETSGIHGAAAMALLTSAAKGAAAGLGNVDDITNTLVSVTNAYKDKTLTAAKALDIMAAAETQGHLQAGQLASTLGAVISIAAKAGVSFDQVAGAVAEMTKQGLPASRAVTALRFLLQSLYAPTAIAAKAMTQFGVDSAQVANQLRDKGLAFVLNELWQASGKNIAGFSKMIGGMRSLVAASNLTGKSAKDFNHILDATVKSTGDVGRAFERTAKSPAFIFARALNELKVLGTEAGQAFVTMLEPIAQFGDRAFKFINNLSPAVKLLVERIFLLTGAVALLEGKIMRFSGTIIDLIALTVLANKSFLFLLGSIGLVVAAITLLAAGAILVIKNWDKVGPFFMQLWEQIKQVALDAFNALQKWWQDNGKQITADVLDFAKAVGQFLAEAFTALKNTLGPVLAALFQVGKVLVPLGTLVLGFASSVLQLFNYLGALRPIIFGIAIAFVAWKIINTVAVWIELLSAKLRVAVFNMEGLAVAIAGTTWSNLIDNAALAAASLGTLRLSLLAAAYAFTFWQNVSNDSKVKQDDLAKAIAYVNMRMRQGVAGQEALTEAVRKFAPYVGKGGIINDFGDALNVVRGHYNALDNDARQFTNDVVVGVNKSNSSIAALTTHLQILLGHAGPLAGTFVKFADGIALASNYSDKAKIQLADIINDLYKLNPAVSAATTSTIDWFISQGNLTAAMRVTQKAIGDYTQKSLVDFANATQNVIGLTADQDKELLDLIATIDNSKIALTEAQVATLNTTLATKGLSAGFDYLNTILQNNAPITGILTKGLDDATTAIKAAEHGLNGLTGTNLTSWADKTGAAISDISGLLTDLAGTAHLTMKKVIQSFNDQAKAITNFRHNLEVLLEHGAPEELIAQLAGMGIKGANLAQILSHATGPQLRQLARDLGIVNGQASGIGDDLKLGANAWKDYGNVIKNAHDPTKKESDAIFTAIVNLDQMQGSLTQAQTKTLAAMVAAGKYKGALTLLSSWLDTTKGKTDNLKTSIGELVNQNYHVDINLLVHGNKLAFDLAYQEFRAQMGFEGWVNKPTHILVGEGSEPEWVQVVPKHKMVQTPMGMMTQQSNPQPRMPAMLQQPVGSAVGGGVTQEMHLHFHGDHFEPADIVREQDWYIRARNR